MTSKEILTNLASLNPDAKVWKEFDDALIGIAARPCQRPVAVYSMESLIAGVMKREKIGKRTAVDLVDKHLLKTDLGKGAPVIIVETLSKDYTIGLGRASEKDAVKNQINPAPYSDKSSQNKASKKRQKA